jgi:hypothetical protein
MAVSLGWPGRKTRLFCFGMAFARAAARAFSSEVETGSRQGKRVKSGIRSMIRKSGYRFSEKIMLKQKVGAG